MQKALALLIQMKSLEKIHQALINLFATVDCMISWTFQKWKVMISLRIHSGEEKIDELIICWEVTSLKIVFSDEVLWNTMMESFHITEDCTWTLTQFNCLEVMFKIQYQCPLEDSLQRTPIKSAPCSSISKISKWRNRSTLFSMEPLNCPRRRIKRSWEAIDRDIMRGMISSKQKVKAEQFKYEQSVELDQAGYQVRC
jgi:hypothetical protein